MRLCSVCPVILLLRSSALTDFGMISPSSLPLQSQLRRNSTRWIVTVVNMREKRLLRVPLPCPLQLSFPLGVHPPGRQCHISVSLQESFSNSIPIKAHSSLMQWIYQQSPEELQCPSSSSFSLVPPLHAEDELTAEGPVQQVAACHHQSGRFGTKLNLKHPQLP